MKKRAGALGHRKGQTWRTYVAKPVASVVLGPFDLGPATPVTPPDAFNVGTSLTLVAPDPYTVAPVTPLSQPDPYNTSGGF